jgi:hypothetical protein
VQASKKEKIETDTTAQTVPFLNLMIAQYRAANNPAPTPRHSTGQTAQQA